METLIFAILALVVSVLALFNYYLNLAPGTDPEDFSIGPQELNITCDCYLNTLILGGILVIALGAGSGLFESRTELYISGIIAFVLVTIAGIIGRRRRHREWEEFDKIVRRAIPKKHFMLQNRTPVDIIFDDEDDEDEYYDDY
jgi:hypothetical protein